MDSRIHGTFLVVRVVAWFLLTLAALFGVHVLLALPLALAIRFALTPAGGTTSLVLATVAALPLYASMFLVMLACGGLPLLLLVDAMTPKGDGVGSPPPSAGPLETRVAAFNRRHRRHLAAAAAGLIIAPVALVIVPLMAGASPLVASESVATFLAGLGALLASVGTGFLTRVHDAVTAGEETRKDA